MPLTDAEAIARSRTEPERFRIVFERHYDAVWRYLRHRFGRSAADELASEVFARAFAARGRYRDETGTALPWLLGIAVNVAAGHARRQARQLRAYARVGEERSQDLDVDGLVARLAAHDQGPRLAGALAELGRDDCETLLLSAIAGLSHAEVAEALGIPIGTVGSRLHRARAVLAPMLEEACRGRV
jgi:RNA polymerase sigma-70 factor (ECF subfamily)